MRNARMDESQAGIKIARRNINNVRYTDNTTFMAGSKEKLKSLLMKVKEESKNAGLKLNIQQTKIMAPSSITSWQIEGEKVEAVTDFTFLGSKITADGGYGHEIKRRNGTPLPYSCLEKPMDGGAWWAPVHGVAKSQA